MTIHIHSTNALSLLAEAVAEHGSDYVYPGAETSSCSYTDEDGSPSCIVGHVLAKAGVKLAPLHEYEWDEGHLAESASVDGLAEEWATTLDIEITEEAALVLRAAQVEQDSGGSWGRALAAAKGALDFYGEG